MATITYTLDYGVRTFKASRVQVTTLPSGRFFLTLYMGEAIIHQVSSVISFVVE